MGCVEGGFALGDLFETGQEKIPVCRFAARV